MHLSKADLGSITTIKKFPLISFFSTDTISKRLFNYFKKTSIIVFVLFYFLGDCINLDAIKLTLGRTGDIDRSSYNYS